MAPVYNINNPVKGYNLNDFDQLNTCYPHFCEIVGVLCGKNIKAYILKFSCVQLTDRC